MCIVNDKIEIHNLSISDLDIFGDSSSEFVYNNIYTCTAYDIIENEDNTRKIYKY
jgi:hypothetical protein